MYTIEQYNSLKAAIAQGALRVRYGDKEVEYRTLAEMKSTIREMEAELFPTKVKITRTFGTFTKDIQ